MNRLHCILVLLSFPVFGTAAIAAAEGLFIADYPTSDRYAVGLRLDKKGVITEVGIIEKAGEKEWKLLPQTIVSGEKERFTISWEQQKGSRVVLVKTEINVSASKDSNDVRVSIIAERIERDKEKKEIVARAGTETESKTRLKTVNK